MYINMPGSAHYDLSANFMNDVDALTRDGPAAECPPKTVAETKFEDGGAEDDAADHPAETGGSDEKFTAPCSSRPRAHGRWRELLLQSDAEGLWHELFRLVSRHPSARGTGGTGPFMEAGRPAPMDLTQELFVRLLSKNRFQCYLETGMSDTEIELEISQIELKNILTAELRKRCPESYRIARRIADLARASPRFGRFDQGGSGGRPHRKLANQIYGLSCWPAEKSRRPLYECKRLAQKIPVQKRDTRLAGRSGDAQIIISNSDLETLIVRVLEAIDSPVELRALRSLVMSLLPLMDINGVVPINGASERGPDFFFDPPDREESPKSG